MSHKVLIINPGSTSTKIGVFEDETLLFEETLRHSTEEISSYPSIVAQKDFRKNLITDLLARKNFDIKSLDVVVGRGGMLRPCWYCPTPMDFGSIFTSSANGSCRRRAIDTALLCPTSNFGNSSVASFDAEYTLAPASLTMIYRSGRFIS